MKKIKCFIILNVFLLFLLISCPVFGESFKLKWVEADVTLNRNGSADVVYYVKWSCQNANLHGFYFEGFSE